MRKLWILIPVLAMIAAACGGSGSGSGSPLTNQALDQAADQADANVDVNTDGASGTFQATDSDGDTVSGDSFTTVPPDFPLPVPDRVDNIDASVTESGQDKTWLLMFDFDTSRVDEISKLYESAATDQGFTIDGTETNTDGYTMMATNGDITILVTMYNYDAYTEAAVEWARYG